MPSQQHPEMTGNIQYETPHMIAIEGWVLSCACCDFLQVTCLYRRWKKMLLVVRDSKSSWYRYSSSKSGGEVCKRDQNRNIEREKYIKESNPLSLWLNNQVHLVPLEQISHHLDEGKGTSRRYLRHHLAMTSIDIITPPHFFETRSFDLPFPRREQAQIYQYGVLAPPKEIPQKAECFNPLCNKVICRMFVYRWKSLCWSYAASGSGYMRARVDWIERRWCHSTCSTSHHAMMRSLGSRPRSCSPLAIRLPCLLQRF